MVLNRGIEFYLVYKTIQTRLANQTSQCKALIVPSLKEEKMSKASLFRVDDVNEARKRIQSGADVNAREYDGTTPLHSCKNAQVAKLLIDHGADINARDYYGRTPLITCTDLDTVKLLLDRGADLNITIKMSDALRETWIDGLDDKGILNNAVYDFGSPKIQEEIGEDPLYSLDRSEHENKVIDAYLKEYIYHLKDEFMDADDFELTALHGWEGWADDEKPDDNYDKYMKLMHPDLVSMYKSDVAHPKYDSDSGCYYLLDHAFKQFKIVGLRWIGFARETFLRPMIEHGADIILRDYYGRTMLHHCENTDFAEFLFAQCQKRYIPATDLANAKDRFGVTALHLAAQKDAALTKCLIDHGADVNARDNDGQTPLFFCKSVETAKILIAHGTDANARDNAGQSSITA